MTKFKSPLVNIDKEAREDKQVQVRENVHFYIFYFRITVSLCTLLAYVRVLSSSGRYIVIWLDPQH